MQKQAKHRSTSQQMENCSAHSLLLTRFARPAEPLLQNFSGWGWDNFVQEANSGSGLKVKNWMRPICQYVVPIAVAVIYIYGLATFAWK